jgi:WD repeat and SOF domain-containing protein 1
MQRVSAVRFSADASYVISASDDTNIRIWKANASKALGVVAGRQERSDRVTDTIKKRFSHMPEVKRISRDKPIPKSIKKAGKLRHVQMESEHRKQDNRKRHAKEGQDDVSIQPERKRAIIKEMK